MLRLEVSPRGGDLEGAFSKTLFLDRDGVINKRQPDAYIKCWEDFIFEKRTLEAFKILRLHFDYLFIVTNQAGIGKGIMEEKDLLDIHSKMLQNIKKEGIKIDGIYYCPHRKEENCACRKPNIGMAGQAKNDFPNLDFQQATIVGDSISDMEFGFRLGMQTILIVGKQEETEAAAQLSVTARFESLWEYANSIV